MAGPAAQRESQRSVKIRSGPGLYYDILKHLDAGSKLEVVEGGKRWIKVKHSSGTVGWVSSRVFTRRPKAKGYRALREARGLEGVAATVVTMATRGLTGGHGGASPSMAPMLRDFLASRPFEPHEWVSFAKELPARPLESFPEWMTAMGAPIEVGESEDGLEHRLGLQLALQVLQDVELVTDPQLDAYVNKVGVAVASASSRFDQPWRFVVFEQAQPEAFSAPGGFVFISTGLLVCIRDEAELAGLLGHQVAHVTLGHDLQSMEEMNKPDPSLSEQDRLQQMLEAAYRALRTPRTASQELAADAYGAAFAAGAGYDPQGLGRLVQRENEFEARGADYPSAQQRWKIIQRVAALVDGRRVKHKSRFERFAVKAR